MAKSRSPNYPVTSLEECLEAVRGAFRQEVRNKMSRLVLAKHIGYSSLNGRALGKIGALRAYGLIEGSADELRVSDDAVALLQAPSGSPDRAAALERCALRPTLFRELRNEFPGEQPPSEENLKYDLIKRGYTPDAAGKAAKTYLATIALVSGIRGDYDSGAESEDKPKMHAASASTPTRGMHSLPKPGIERAELPLPEGAARVEFPKEMSAESYSDFEEWTKLVLRLAKRAVKSGASN